MPDEAAFRIPSSVLVTEVLTGLRNAVILCDAQGKVEYANPACRDVLGLRPEDLAGREAAIFFMPDDLEHLYPNLLYLASQGESFSGELMLRRADGESFFAYLTLRPCRQPGQPPMLVLGVDDIDRQKRLEQILEHTHYEELLTIANSIAHELRNPLVGIGGFVNRMYQSCQNDMTKDEYYKHIVSNLNKIEGLVRKVRNLVSLPPPKLARQSLPALVDKALDPYRPKLLARHIKLSQDLRPVQLLADGELLVKCFAILTENAMDAVGESGQIKIDAGPEDGTCKVVFKDDGRGIAPDDLPNIFNPFFSTKADGVGIDLALLKRIVLIHGGQVRAESSPGGGATFIMRLPLERRRAIRTAPLPGRLDR